MASTPVCLQELFTCASCRSKQRHYPLADNMKTVAFCRLYSGKQYASTRTNHRCLNTRVGHRTFWAALACFLAIIFPPAVTLSVGVTATSPETTEISQAMPTVGSVGTESVPWERFDEAEDLVSTKDPCKARKSISFHIYELGLNFALTPGTVAFLIWMPMFSYPI